MFRRIRQGGAIVFRTRGSDVEVLVVRAKKNPKEWVFPKGHVEPDENLLRTAQREAEEEAGVVARVIGRVGEPLRLLSGDERVSVQYYVLEATGSVEPKEPREPTWLSFAAARDRLSHEDAKLLLDRAKRVVRGELALQWRPSSKAGSDGEESSKEAAFRAFLLAEHEQVADSYVRNEEDGERRVTFFMTFAAGAAAVLGFLIGDRPEQAGLAPNLIHPLVVVTLAVVGATGLLTFRRVVTRNAASDRYKRGLQRIRRYFLDDPGDPHVPFLPFDPFEPIERPRPSWWSIGNGGWMETVALVESISAGALAAAIVPTSDWWRDVAVGLVAAAVTWVVLLRWAARPDKHQRA